MPGKQSHTFPSVLLSIKSRNQRQTDNDTLRAGEIQKKFQIIQHQSVVFPCVPMVDLRIGILAVNIESVDTCRGHPDFLFRDGQGGLGA